MEKAILKTLIYADIFDYPLKIEELHKWLIGEKATLRQVEKALKKSLESRVKSQGGYYFLPRRKELVGIRKRREKQSQIYFRKAKILSQILKLVPWIKLVGVSGGLAMNNAGKRDDIDLFIITGGKRLWISRFLALGLLSLTGQRRKVKEKGRNIAGKICINTILDTSSLEQKSKDIFLAHEVLQMRVLWQRDGVYTKYLEDNNWAFKFLPNWVTNASSPHRVVARGKLRRGSNSESEVVNRRGLLSSLCLDNWIPAFAGMTMERVAKWLQMRIMQKPQGLERIQPGALYFHPQDCRKEVLTKYKKRLAIISP